MKNAKLLLSILLTGYLASHCLIVKAQYMSTHEKVTQDLDAYGHENGLGFYRQPNSVIKAYRVANAVTETLGFKSVHQALVFFSAGWLSYKTCGKAAKFMKLLLPPVFWLSSDFVLGLFEHGMDTIFVGLAREKSAVQLEKAKATFEEAKKAVRAMSRYPID